MMKIINKIVNKISILFAGVLVLSTLAACEKFDASSYVKAILDNSYYNDSTGIVDQGMGTVEEAAEIYNQGINSQIDVMFDKVAISDELAEEYRQFFEDLFSNVKYTVGEAVEVDDKTFEVNVTYEKMNVFTDVMIAYEAKLTEMVEVWNENALAGEEVPAEEEMNEQLFAMLKDCMVAELQDATFEEPATATIKVELVDKVWTPSQEDLIDLEYALFDFESLYHIE